jgi:hypothetical protein
MFYRILKELAFSFMLCVAERIAERMLLPGFRSVPIDDPARAESLMALISEALGLMAMIWLFTATLYAIGLLYRRPLRWQIPPAVAVVIVVLIFAGSLSTWSTMPRPPATVSGVR